MYKLCTCSVCFVTADEFEGACVSAYLAAPILTCDRQSGKEGDALFPYLCLHRVFAGNAGAILVLGRDLVMVPKLIHPLPAPRTTSSTHVLTPRLTRTLLFFFLGNAGAILVLGRDLVMVPKLIHPLPPSTPCTPDSQGNIDEDLHAHPTGNDTWMQSINDERPPTPPRGRPHVPGSSLEYF